MAGSDYKPIHPQSVEDTVDDRRRRGRGAQSNVTGRFESEIREKFDDGWESLGGLEPFKTEVRIEQARQIIATNDSPDIGFDQSINPYRGCEHGCIYCYARPSHSYLGYSAGLDFETKLIAKTNAAEALRRELARPGYKVKTIMLGSNTDPYQPIEREYQITRRILEIFDATNHPVSILTKSALILRDLDLIAALASRGLVRVALSVTTLDHKLARRMEPRASTPMRRLEALRQLSDAGVPAAVMNAPIIPAINDGEIEKVLQAAAAAGVKQAGYVLLRLPREISPLFREWLQNEFPDRAARVMSLMRSMRRGADYVASWSERQTGVGPYAEQIALRFKLAARRLGLNQSRCSLATGLFNPPRLPGNQLDLFG